MQGAFPVFAGFILDAAIAIENQSAGLVHLVPTGLELSHPEVLRGVFKVVGRLVCVQVRLLVKALVAAWVRA